MALDFGILDRPGTRSYLPLELAVEEIFQDIEVVAERERTETATSEQVVQGEMIDVQRVLKIMGVRVRVGFRIFNVTNTFNARDIQNNIDAASFGTTFNSPGRAFGGTFQIVQ